MDADACDPLAKLPQPLAQWCMECAPAVPPPMLKSRTFYEAFKASRKIKWRRKLDQFHALHVWATVALIGHPRTRPYMAKLIPDEAAGLHWTSDAGQAALAAMKAERDSGTPPRRLFRQRRDAAIRGLREARKNLRALDIDFQLHKLLSGPDVRDFRETIEDFTVSTMKHRRDLAWRARERVIANGGSVGDVFTATLGEMLKVREDKIPSLDDLLEAAETILQSTPEPETDRHGLRARYLRAMFHALRDSPIKQRRVAFLTHASSAVFGERIERRDVRRLVYDLVAKEKELFELFERMG